MATCVNCDKEWNSWGSGDAFCSDECEGEHRNKIHLMLTELVKVSNSEAVNILTSIIESASDIDELRSYLVNLFEWQNYLQRNE